MTDPRERTNTTNPELARERILRKSAEVAWDEVTKERDLLRKHHEEQHHVTNQPDMVSRDMWQAATDAYAMERNRSREAMRLLRLNHRVSPDHSDCMTCEFLASGGIEK